MPYEISFAKQVPLLDREEYINVCCVGGDAVVNQLLPSVRSRYIDIQTNQEDWGWFIWFNKGILWGLHNTYSVTLDTTHPHFRVEEATIGP